MLIFFKQNQAEEKDKNKTEGTGIGLTVVNRVIELHYGRVRVESEPGEGAKFIISLPMDKISLEA